MSEDQEPDYVNDPEPTAETHNTVHSGRRLKVTALRVAVVRAVVLIVAYVFDGVALFLNCKERRNALTTNRDMTTTTTTTGTNTFMTNRDMTTTTTKTTTATIIKVPTCTRKLHCDSDWNLNGPKCYYFSTNKSSWIQSKDKCETLGGRLVKINNRKKQRFLAEKFRSLMTENGDKFWIGLTDSEREGEWKWTDGSSLDPNLKFWFTTEPDNWKGVNNRYPEGEDCVRMGEKGTGFEEKCWFDKDCNALHKYICEKNPTQSPDCQ